MAKQIGLLPTGGGPPLPLTSVDVTGKVGEALCELTVRQTFENKESKPLEVIYTFPVDASSVVTGIAAKLGDRMVRGEVQEKEAAKDAYEDAIAAGGKAALVEESAASRDVFTTTLGNLGPGQSATVEITVVSPLQCSGESTRLVIPTTVAPRYELGSGQEPATKPAATTGTGAGGDATTGAGAGPDVDDAEGAGYPVSVSVDIGMAGRIRSVHVPSHPADDFVTVLLHPDAEGGRTSGAEGQPADAESGAGTMSRKNAQVVWRDPRGAGLIGGDFVIDILTENPHAPRAWVEQLSGQDAREQGEASEQGVSGAAAGSAGGSGSGSGSGPSQHAVMVSLQPDLDADTFDNDPRVEYTFLVDRSGSMAGSRMRQVKDALAMALRSLPSTCKFQIVSFGTHRQPLFDGGARQYSDETLQTALAHVRSMEANLGGTEILAPLTESLVEPLPFRDPVLEEDPDPEWPRVLVLMTDGDVENTRAVVDFVRGTRSKQGVRVFSLGFGSEASSALVKGVAEAGGGKAEMVASGDRIEEPVARQMNRALQPALSNVKVDWGELRPFVQHSWPSKHVPVFAGDRLLMTAILKPGVWELGQSGKEGALPAVASVTLQAIGPDGSLSWKLAVPLRELSDRGGDSDSDEDDVKQEGEQPAGDAAATTEADAAGSGTGSTGGAGSVSASTGAGAPQDAYDNPGVRAMETGVIHGAAAMSTGRAVHCLCASRIAKQLESSTDKGDKKKALDLCLQFGVASKLASFVAVDYASAAAGGDAAVDDMATRFVGQAALKPALEDAPHEEPEESLYVQMLRADNQPIPPELLRPQREEGRALPAAAGRVGRGGPFGVYAAVGGAPVALDMAMDAAANEVSEDSDGDFDVGMHAGHARAMARARGRVPEGARGQRGGARAKRRGLRDAPSTQSGGGMDVRPAGLDRTVYDRRSRRASFGSDDLEATTVRGEGLGAMQARSLELRDQAESFNAQAAPASAGAAPSGGMLSGLMSAMGFGGAPAPAPAAEQEQSVATELFSAVPSRPKRAQTASFKAEDTPTGPGRGELDDLVVGSLGSSEDESEMEDMMGGEAPGYSVPGTARERMQDLVQGQSAAGDFRVTAAFRAMAGDGWEGKQPGELAAAGDSAQAVWVTALAVAILRKQCADLSAEWAAVARKASRWARRALRGAGVADAAVAWRAAERAAGAHLHA